MHTRRCNGMPTSTFFRLCSAAPSNSSFAALLSVAADALLPWARIRPERYSAVMVFAAFSASGAPNKTTSPPRSDAGKKQAGGLIGRRRQVQVLEELAPAVDRQEHQIVHRQAWKPAQYVIAELRALRQESPRRIERAVRVLLRAQAPQERVGLQTRAGADRARRVGAVTRKQHAHVHLVGLGLEPAEKARDTVPGARPGFPPAHP